ncbi:prefoldin subunit 6 [Leptopilina heterotoma]|uniref:prefoldin subunit 6 n=1 Tax=Leptopilina heterotoma TaxID=63436 RepID=UPI001CA812E6|nr:prefoldin subunit 6 [Leptopilina heterotoma]XP_043470075.1 prefoldin subunit 6 [Leptopilina heterotoma]
MSQGFSKKLQDEVDKFKLAQKEYHKAVNKRQQLDGQLNENTTVKEELDLLKAENDVFKLIGPVLVKQDLEEAKQNISKRMSYISSEIKRTDELIATLDKKQESHRANLEKLQQSFQQQQQQQQRKTKA